MYRINQLVDNFCRKIKFSNSSTTFLIFEKFLRGASWSFIGALISQGLTLLASVVVARELGQEVFGELGIIQSTLVMFALFAGSSLGYTATKYVAELIKPDPERAGRLIGLTYISAFIIGGMLSLILVFGAPFLSKFVLNAPHLINALRISSVILFFNSMNGAQTGTLIGVQSFQKIALVNLLRGIVTFPLMFVGALVWRLNGTIVALAISAIFGFILTQKYVKQEVVDNGLIINYFGGKAEWRILFSFTLPTILSGLAFVPIMWWANVVLVNQNNGYIEMGIFNATNQWRSALLFLPAVLTQPTLPLLSHLFGIGSYEEYKRLLFFNLAIVSLSVFIPAIGISIGAKWIMSIYGFHNDNGVLILRILSLASIISAATSVIGSVISSMGNMWHGLFINIIWATVFIISFYSFKRDSLGLSEAYLVSYLVHLIVISGYSIFFLRKKLNQSNLPSLII